MSESEKAGTPPPALTSDLATNGNESPGKCKEAEPKQHDEKDSSAPGTTAPQIPEIDSDPELRENCFLGSFGRGGELPRPSSSAGNDFGSGPTLIPDATGNEIAPDEVPAITLPHDLALTECRPSGRFLVHSESRDNDLPCR